MIIYSVTISIDKAIEADWLKWMKEKHVPDMLATGYFESSTMLKLIDPLPDPGSANYSFQYICKDLETLKKYQQNAAPALQEEHTQRYHKRFVAFRTVLETV